MAERQLSDRESSEDDQLQMGSGPKIQDLEHDARPETRTNNAGVKVPPPKKDESAAEPPAEETDPVAETERKLDEARTRLPPG